MKTQHFKKLLFSAAMVALLAGRCKQPEPIPPKGDYDGGYFVLNEGQFMHDNASVSFLSEDLQQVENDVYANVNDNQTLGDIAQSMFVNGDKIYFLVNNSDRVVVAGRWDMKHKGIMNSYVKAPRYMVKVSDRYAVMSNWGEVFDNNWNDVEDDYLAWVDLENDVVSDTLHVDLGPNQMVYQNSKLYVGIAGVSQSRNKVLVLDPVSKQTITEISTGDRPKFLAKDSDGHIWVLSTGNAAWTGNETAGKLQIIDPATDTAVKEFDFQTTQHPEYLAYNADNHKMYFILDGKVYAISFNDSALPTTPVVNLSGEVTKPYGLYYHDGKLFVTDAVDYQTAGKTVVYDTQNYHKVAELNVGLLPNSVRFNRSDR